ncbi:MAG: DUF924 domain-containing protein [Hydrogenophaga sp.]|nr:DUF924 domain-containing protein [Hydrogenophaga sp.]
MPPIPPAARPLLDLWFGDGLQRGWPSAPRNDLWFNSTPEQDAELRAAFGADVQAALAGQRDDWAATPLGRLALVLLLDQLPRNLFRRQAGAFAGDARAQAQVQAALAAGEDETLPAIARVFLYLPLTHAESLPLQDECVRRFERLCATAAPEHKTELDDNLRYAVLHRDIVARFGRFPHRNDALGRECTAAELEFLTDGPRFGQ